MAHRHLRSFVDSLEQVGHLKKIDQPIDPKLEITEVCYRSLQMGGPALLFNQPKGYQTPLLGNLFGHLDRITYGFGGDSPIDLRELGQTLAFLKTPNPPKGIKDALSHLPLMRQLLNMAPKKISQPSVQTNRLEGDKVSLDWLPIQTCWPEDVAPLITWGMVITENPDTKRINLGIYRAQPIAHNRVIVRWLGHRGGALDYQRWCKKHPNEPFPIAIAIGADPATILGAVIPLPDTLSEFAFAGLLRGEKTRLGQCISHHLPIPAEAEIVLEGFIYPNDTAPEGPYGDHTGYYNEVESFPVMTIERITHRDNPIYLSTYTGKPPDEPAMLGLALNELFVPLIQKQFPEIVDFYLPPEGCSYRMCIVSIQKQYAGHGKQIMMGIWSYLRQFMYTKWIVVVDSDVDIRQWPEVIWAITTRADPVRDTFLIDNSPIDYLDFASPKPSLGGKAGIDATNKWAGETNREWGRPISQDSETISTIDAIWEALAIHKVES